LTVGNSLLEKIIIEDNGMLSVITEVFSHGGTGVGGKELKRSRITGSGSYDDAVVHGTLAMKLCYQLGNSRPILTNANIDTSKGILLGFLVDHGTESNGSLPCLTIPDDQLLLTIANGIRPSTAFNPVNMGSDTDSQGMIPGALTSARDLLQLS
jgi:hypothetical protein